MKRAPLLLILAGILVLAACAADTSAAYQRCHASFSLGVPFQNPELIYD